MYIDSIHLQNFRNYSSLAVSFPSQGAILKGLNGTGKTNLLESIFLLCTGKSQRNARKKELIKFESDFCFVEGNFISEATNEKIVASMGIDRKDHVSMKQNGEHIQGISNWYGFAKVLTFSPEDMYIVTGPPGERRRYLDMLISQVDSDYLRELIAYRKIVQNRNKLLSEKIIDKQLDIFDEQLVEHGSRIVEKRFETVNQLSSSLCSYHSEISAGKDIVSMQYRVSFPVDFDSNINWKNVFYDRLKLARKNDISWGFSSIGPHRDDLVLLIHNKPAKDFASQGQCRSLALALRLCGMSFFDKDFGGKIIFLIDDALSELDERRASRIFPLIEGKGQVFVTTPLNEVQAIHTFPQYIVAEGSVRQQ